MMPCYNYAQYYNHVDDHEDQRQRSFETPPRAVPDPIENHSPLRDVPRKKNFNNDNSMGSDVL
jgi:hypothetical protein